MPRASARSIGFRPWWHSQPQMTKGAGGSDGTANTPERAATQRMTADMAVQADSPATYGSAQQYVTGQQAAGRSIDIDTCSKPWWLDRAIERLHKQENNQRDMMDSGKHCVAPAAACRCRGWQVLTVLATCQGTRREESCFVLPECRSGSPAARGMRPGPMVLSQAAIWSGHSVSCPQCPPPDMAPLTAALVI